MVIIQIRSNFSHHNIIHNILAELTGLRKEKNPKEETGLSKEMKADLGETIKDNGQLVRQARKNKRQSLPSIIKRKQLCNNIYSRGRHLSSINS